MNFNDSCLVSQPKNMNIKLFKHQLSSIYNMEKLEFEQKTENDDFIKKTTIGFNTDIAGYGKTYSMLGLIKRDKMEWDTEFPFLVKTIISESNNLIIKTKIERYFKLNCTLILVSPSILKQWKDAIYNNTDLTFITITSKKDIENTEIKNFDIILIIPSMYNNFVKSYSKYAWKRFIFDEPAHIRVSGMKDIKAGFMWFVTSTPNDILNHHQSCRGSMIFKIISNITEPFQEKFKGMIIKNDDNFVKLSFKMPKTNYIEYRCFQPIFKVINGMVDPIITKMIDSGNIEGAITSLGGSKTKNIVELVKRKKSEEIEQVKSKININKLRSQDKKVEEFQNIKKDLEHQLDIIDERFNEMLNNNNCNICMSDINNAVMEPGCHNLFCGECLLTWLKNHNNCPICRKDVILSDLIYIENKSKESKESKKSKPRILLKTEQIIKIINSTKNGKFLVCSDYTESFNPICKILDKNNIKFCKLKGNSSCRSKIIDDYKTGNINIIFLDSSFDSAGINLTETTDIILYHNMKNKNQIISRAERIGRDKELNVHQLLDSDI